MDKKNYNSTIEPIKSASDLWTSLLNGAGLDTVFFDKDIAEDNETQTGLYQQLNIDERGSSFPDDLNKNNITVEQLLTAIFCALQPYGMMMSDLCIFFEKYGIKQVDKELKIEFDFNSKVIGKLQFKLEHFRSIISEMEKIKVLFIDTSIDENHLWKLNKLFSEDISNNNEAPQQLREDYVGKPTNATSIMIQPMPNIVRDWIENLNNEKIDLIGEPTIDTPITGEKGLDQQLGLCMNLWKSFVNSCLLFGQKRLIAHDNIKKKREIMEQMAIEPINNIPTTNSWPPNFLASHLHDRWPSYFLDVIFSRVERINKMDNSDKSIAASELSAKLKDFLDSFPIIISTEDRMVKRLTNLLNLPIWKQRHELYSTWMLTNIEKSLEDYPLTVHHTDGVLKMPFKPTHLITAHSTKGELLLYSEMRLQAELQSKKRNGAIQPDYILFKQDTKAENAIAVIEVKQYRKPSNSNFGDAIRDYSAGCLNAHIFLVNYGKISSKLPLKEIYKERNWPIEEVHPSSTKQKEFISLLQKKIPPPFQNFLSEQQQILLAEHPVKQLIVDISSSMLIADYNQQQISQLLNTLLSSSKEIVTMIAVDEIMRAEWNPPTIGDIQELLHLGKGDSTGFNHLLPKVSTPGLTVITDADGREQMANYKGSPYLLIVIEGFESIKFSWENRNKSLIP